MISKSCVARSEKEVPPLSWTTRTPWRGERARWEATALIVRPQEMPTLMSSRTSRATSSAPTRPTWEIASASSATQPWATRTHARAKRSCRRKASSEASSRGSWISTVTNPRARPWARSLATVGREMPMRTATSAWLKSCW